MWNNFHTRFVDMGKEAATEELQMLHLQHILYIST